MKRDIVSTSQSCAASNIRRLKVFPQTRHETDSTSFSYVGDKVSSSYLISTAMVKRLRSFRKKSKKERRWARLINHNDCCQISLMGPNLNCVTFGASTIFNNEIIHTTYNIQSASKKFTRYVFWTPVRTHV